MSTQTTMELDRILCGDALEMLRTLPGESVQTCVTSPPYYGLRDYGTATWVGGLEECDHSPEKRGGRFATPVTGKQASNAGSGTASRRDCPCGAIRIDQQIGLEETPEAFVARLVAVFAEVRRVLRRDGTLWVNMGDSYAGSWGNYSGENRGKGKQRSISVGSLPAPAWNGRELERPAASRPLPGIKPKDLIGIPWMLAFALRADGWYLRMDCIWHKPNPMPESVTDRPTKAHEYMFLLSKSPKYFYDGEAIKEDPAPQSLARIRQANFANQTGGPKDYRVTGINPNRSMRQTLENFARNPGRNKRSVWTVATAPYAEAHFATFPPALIEPCILAGSRAGDVVLDPFAGSGTTCAVAKRHSRRYLGLELNPDYVTLAERRIAKEVQPVLWSAVAPVEVA